MRHMRVVGSIVGLLAAASACATTGGTIGSSRFDRTSPTRAPGKFSDAAARDSAAAQELADREGPGASISAQIVSTASGARHVKASFHLESDAYVVVGHVDADGILRVVFPADPKDDGFVQGGKSFQTNEFLAGFTDEYRYRASDPSLYRTASSRTDSYDGGLGYVFVIASWRPMHFDRFATEGRWDTFELASDDYRRDPRPAIQEFASLLAGDNSEAYTVKYARYFNTIAYASASPYDNSEFGYCSGYSPMGFASSPFDNLYNGYGSYAQYGENFLSRGLFYTYHPGGGCYTSSYGGYGLGYGFGGYIAQTPPFVTPPRPRAFDVNGHRRPPTPEPAPTHRFPVNGPDQSKPATAVPQNAHFSPEYRQRGLITSDEPASGVSTRGPRIEARVPGEARTRPSIQEMTGSRTEPAQGRDMRSRARVDESASGGSMGQGWTQQQQRQQQAQREARQQNQQGQEQGQEQRQSRGRFDPSAGDNSQRGSQRPASADGPRAERAERTSSPAPRQETRSAPPPRSESPRMEAPRSAPPPAAAAPASAPATSTSTGSKPPTR